MTVYDQYRAEISADVIELIKKKGCQPILFVGSGFTKRYCGAPNWEELLTELGKACPKVEHDFAYYRQSKMTMPAIGTIFAKAYKEWAWGTGKAKFPPEFFKADAPEDIFLKYAVANRLKALGPDAKGSFGLPELDAEIVAFKNISPHAVITTNYDQLLEPIFKDYDPIVGQQVIRHAYMSIGEVFKIHGCISDPHTLTLTDEDYSRFALDKKYLSAKLFTYFVEHPLLFVGYGAGDENIQSILQEIDHMLPEGVGLIDNIYIMEWKKGVEAEKEVPAKERIVPVGNGRSIRIKNITADSFEWVFQAFKSEAPLEKVNIKLLRSVSHRIFNLVRKDAAKNTVEINFEMLGHALENPQEFAKVYGVAALNNPALLNITHPFLPGAAAQKFGLSWQKFNQLITALSQAHGFDMRASDNKYHAFIKPTRRYSQEAIDLLEKFQKGEELPDLNDPAATGQLSDIAHAVDDKAK